MNKPTKRPTRLFPRAVGEVVKQATRPLMDKQGKIYGALLRDWPTIVGKDRASCTRPMRLQWPTHDATGATLHLEASAARAPELTYELEAMLEQCARYFGYKAITRMVLQPVHGSFAPPPAPPKPSAPASTEPQTMTDILTRMRKRIAEDDKPD